MASGMATVTSRNEDTLWLLKDGVNWLVAEPSLAAMAEKIGCLIDDPALRAPYWTGRQRYH
jgi:glycosyltransferase involved in cell wall biosynthesis